MVGEIFGLTPTFPDLNRRGQTTLSPGFPILNPRGQTTLFAKPSTFARKIPKTVL
jgi:hypothetical protein